MHGIGARLKRWREAGKLSQSDAAAILGLPARTYQNYETEARSPNTEGLAALARAGINTNWLLTGDGEMHAAAERNDDRPRAPRKNDLTSTQAELLRAAINAIEEGMVGIEGKMTTEKKTDLVLAVYDLLNNEKTTMEAVLKLVRFTV